MTIQLFVSPINLTHRRRITASIMVRVALTLVAFTMALRRRSRRTARPCAAMWSRPATFSPSAT